MDRHSVSQMSPLLVSMMSLQPLMHSSRVLYIALHKSSAGEEKKKRDDYMQYLAWYAVQMSMLLISALDLTLASSLKVAVTTNSSPDTITTERVAVKYMVSQSPNLKRVSTYNTKSKQVVHKSLRVLQHETDPTTLP